MNYSQVELLRRSWVLVEEVDWASDATDSCCGASATELLTLVAPGSKGGLGWLLNRRFYGAESSQRSQSYRYIALEDGGQHYCWRPAFSWTTLGEGIMHTRSISLQFNFYRRIYITRDGQEYSIRTIERNIGTQNSIRRGDCYCPPSSTSNEGSAIEHPFRLGDMAPLPMLILVILCPGLLSR